MNRKSLNKYLRLVGFVSILGSLLLCASCGKTSSDIADTQKVETVSEQNSISTQTVQATILNTEENKETKKVFEFENPSPLNIANAIIEDLGATVKINAVRDENNNIYVDFSKDSPSLFSGTAEESSVLDSLGLTFIGDLKYTHIYFTIDGEKYETGHVVLEIEEPYM